MSGSHVDDVVAGRTWQEFCDVLRRAGEQVMRPEAPDDPNTRAEGFRYLSRLMRLGLEMHLEYADPDFPGFCVPSHETAKIGADNPDNLYYRATIDGNNEYRIRGERGTVSYISFGSQKGGYESDGRMESTGFLDFHQLEVDADGRFEVIVSQQRQGRNWLPLEPESNQVLVRQTFQDRSSEEPARVSIERLGAGARPEPLSADELHERLLRAANFVEGTARLFADWSQSFRQRPNELPPADQEACQVVGGDANIFYYHGYWELAEDEALVIDVDRIPDCDHWNIQIDNWWMESLDYRYFRITLNQHTAHYNDDGSVTMVLAHRDPGLPNWLETAGHRLGTMCFRWIRAAEHVHPRTRVVSVDSLRGGS